MSIIHLNNKEELFNLLKNHVNSILGNTENILSDLNEILNGNHNNSNINKIFTTQEIKRLINQKKYRTIDLNDNNIALIKKILNNIYFVLFVKPKQIAGGGDNIEDNYQIEEYSGETNQLEPFNNADESNIGMFNFNKNFFITLALIFFYVSSIYVGYTGVNEAVNTNIVHPHFLNNENIQNMQNIQNLENIVMPNSALPAPEGTQLVPIDMQELEQKANVNFGNSTKLTLKQIIFSGFSMDQVQELTNILNMQINQISNIVFEQIQDAAMNQLQETSSRVSRSVNANELTLSELFMWATGLDGVLLVGSHNLNEEMINIHRNMRDLTIELTRMMEDYKKMLLDKSYDNLRNIMWEITKGFYLIRFGVGGLFLLFSKKAFNNRHDIRRGVSRLMNTIQDSLNRAALTNHANHANHAALTNGETNSYHGDPFYEIRDIGDYEGGRKRRKSRKSRKYRKSKKSRKPKKSRKQKNKRKKKKRRTKKK